MTGKRFTVHIRWFNYDKTEGDIELKDNGQPILMSESIDDVQWIKTLLNELHEENEQLKTTIQQLRTDNTKQKKKLNTTMKENEQLKSIKKFAEIHGINIFKIDEAFQKCWNDNGKLIKENEQLKSQLRIYRRIASCSNCDYHDYDEFENSDGSYDEFEVCRKGNDVTERICKDWREL